MTTDILSRAPASHASSSAAILSRLCDGQAMDEGSAHVLFGALVAGHLDDAETEAMLRALPVRAETATEMTGAAKALREAAKPFPRPEYRFADCCGTGGDGSASINISTAAAFVAAAAGLPVAKHGNRSVTSRCGSADVLEALGVRIDVPADISRAALDDVGMCFLYAPAYHYGLRHAAAARRAIGVRTIMNLLGPVVNPAAPPVQLLGVADPATLEAVAQTLAALCCTNALVVHGSGLDEVALHGDTQAIRVTHGGFERLTLRPRDAGIAYRPARDVTGGSVEANAAGLAAVLQGKGEPAHADAVALNAGALLMTAGFADDFAQGVKIAADLIRSGAPFERLRALARATNG